MKMLWGALVVLTALGVAACSGTNHPTPVTTSQTRHTKQSAAASGTVTIGGSINTVTASEANINQTNPSNCTGKNDIYWATGNPKVDPAGATPSPGGYMQVTGVGATPLPCQHVTSSNYITYSSTAIPQVSLNGTVRGVNTDGTFTLIDSSGASTLIVMNGYDSPNVSPADGDTGAVQGYGFKGSGHFVHATSVSLTVPTAQPHSYTWDYGDSGFMKTSNYEYPSSGLQWLTMAQVSDSRSLTEFQSSGVKMEKYTNGIIAQGGTSPEQVFLDDGGVANQKPQTTTNFLHDCAGNALVSTEGSDTEYMQDFTKSAVVTNNQKDRVGSGFSTYYTYLFMDGTSNENGMLDVSTNTAATPCGVSSDSQYMSNLAAGYNQLGVSVLVNGLSAVNYTTAMPCDCIQTAEAVAGGRMEGSYICAPSGSCKNTAGTGEAGYTEPQVWEAEENTEIDMSNANKLLLLEEYDIGVLPYSSAGLAHRMFGFASFFLTYSLANTGVFYGADGFGKDPDPLNTTGARLYPESEVVPLNPVKPEPSNNDIAALQATGGAYYREYQDCFVSGTRIGSCIIAVNPSYTSSVAFPDSAYVCSTCQQLVLRTQSGKGAEITEGGYVTEDGGSPPSTMAADSAYIVFNTAQ